MRVMLTVAMLTAFALISACKTAGQTKAGPPPTSDAPAVATLEAPMAIAEPPFSADEIQAATRHGRTYHFRISSGAGEVIQRMRFEEPSDVGATLISGVVDANGAPVGELKTAPVTWAGLVSHATYPAANTDITEDTVIVPAGSFDAWLYTVTESKDGTKSVTRAWFAKTLPGAPVRHEVTVAGQVVHLMELVEYDRGE